MSIALYRVRVTYAQGIGKTQVNLVYTFPKCAKKTKTGNDAYETKKQEVPSETNPKGDR